MGKEERWGKVRQRDVLIPPNTHVLIFFYYHLEESSTDIRTQRGFAGSLQYHIGSKSVILDASVIILYVRTVTFRISTPGTFARRRPKCSCLKRRRLSFCSAEWTFTRVPGYFSEVQPVNQQERTVYFVQERFPSLQQCKDHRAPLADAQHLEAWCGSSFGIGNTTFLPNDGKTLETYPPLN
eukprot:2249907-Rhodomonas_salina.1